MVQVAEDTTEWQALTRSVLSFHRITKVRQLKPGPRLRFLRSSCNSSGALSPKRLHLVPCKKIRGRVLR